MTITGESIRRNCRQMSFLDSGLILGTGLVWFPSLEVLLETAGFARS